MTRKHTQSCLIWINNQTGSSFQIVSTYLPANYLLPLWLSQFKLLHTQIECTLTTKNSTEAMESLLHFEAELAVIGGGVVNHPLEVSEYIERGEIARVYVQDVNLVNPISLCWRSNDELSPAAEEQFRQAILHIHQPDSPQ